jgi:hypothetical protein
VYLESKRLKNLPTKYNVIPDEVHYTTIPTYYGYRASIFKNSLIIIVRTVYNISEKDGKLLRKVDVKYIQYLINIFLSRFNI